MGRGDSLLDDSLARDLLVIHAKASTDTYFVTSQLLPSLGLPPDRVVLSSALPLGELVITSLERELRHSRVTVLVISPAFLKEKWPLFGQALASHHAIAGQRCVVPILLEDCEVPLRLEARVLLDLRNPENQERELKRLRDLFPSGEASSPSCPVPVAPRPALRPAPRARNPIAYMAILGALALDPSAYLEGPRASSEGARSAEASFSFTALISAAFRALVDAGVSLPPGAARTAIGGEGDETPPPDPKPSGRTAAELEQLARDRLTDSQYEEALRFAKRAFRRNPSSETARLCVLALCSLKRGAETQQYFPHLSPKQQSVLGELCANTSDP